MNFISKRFDRPPPGGDVVPLIVSTGFWSQNIRYGPKMRNCWFEYPLDDGFNTHTNFIPVARALPKENIVTLAIDRNDLNWRGDGVRPGDSLYLYDKDYNLVGNPKILEIRSTKYRRDAVSKVKLVPRIFNMSAVEHTDFVVDKVPEMYNEDTYDVVSVVSSGAGYDFLFDNVTILHSTARPMGVSQMSGIIRNSHFEGGTYGGGITLGPQPQWYLGGLPSNVTIENCTFENSNIFPQLWTNEMGGNYPAGAITVWDGSSSMSNLKIINNRFKNCPVPNIGIYGASDSIISGNIFESPNYFGSDPQSSVCHQDLICFDHLKNRNVTAFDNYLIKGSQTIDVNSFSLTSNSNVQRVETPSNVRKQSWTLVDTYVLDVDSNAVFYYPKNASKIDISSFIRALAITNGRVPKLIVKKGNYLFSQQIRWFFGNNFVIDFSGSNLKLAPRSSIIYGTNITILNYAAVSTLPPPIVESDQTDLIKAKECSQCYPYSKCSPSETFNTNTCCYCETNQCQNAQYAAGKTVILKPLENGQTGAVSWCPCYPYVTCPKEGYSDSDKYKWGLCYCDNDQCRETQAINGFDIRPPIS